MSQKIYVGNLGYTTTNEELSAAFGAHGTVKSASVIMDRDTGRSKGFGFVEMSSSAETDQAINSMNGVQLGGRTLSVNPAKEREPRARGNRY